MGFMTAVSKRGNGGSGDVGVSGENVRAPAGMTLVPVAAQRILALATKSLDMMRNVTGVMKDSLDRAEAYVPPLPVEGGAGRRCRYFRAGVSSRS